MFRLLKSFLIFINRTFFKTYNMSTLRVNNIESYSSIPKINVNDGIQLSGSTSTGNKAVALGRGTIARNYGVAAGLNTVAGGPSGAGVGPSGDQTYTFAQGRSTQAYGNFSHAEGYSTQTNFDYSHAEGYQVSASAPASHAEGYRTETRGIYSHAEGYYTYASGDGAHGEGSFTTASGDYSHAEGIGTVSAGNYQHVQGHYNVSDSSQNTLMIIGNGANHATRRNLIKFTTTAFIVDLGALPQSDPSSPGQLYQTSSALFGGPADLKVLMVSSGSGGA